MFEIIMDALEVLKEDKSVSDVLTTVGAAALALTGGDLSLKQASALFVVLKEAETKIKEITHSEQ